MIRQVIFKPEAELEMEEARSWYEEREPGLGGDFVRCVDACVALARRFPEAYPVAYRAVRMGVVRRFPYLVFYTVEPKQIIIISVFNASRDPKIWKRRA